MLWYGAHLIGAGTLTSGLLIAFLLYLDQFFSPLQQLSAVFDQWIQARISLGRLDELLATPSSTPEAADPIDPGRVGRRRRARGRPLRLLARRARGAARRRPAHRRRRARRPRRHDRRRQVDVRQARRPLLRPDRRAGCSSTATTCATSTCTATAATSATCPRSRSCSRARSARTSPTGGPTPPTSRSSGRPAPSAPTTSCASLPDGYHTPVAETGRSLSAGQRQLLCLARAQLVDPTILILDEATSNLDLATEAEVQRAMNLASQGRTTLLIAHRLQTARNATRIVVVEEGRLVEDGSHDELVAAGGRYAELWDAFDSAQAGAGRRADRRRMRVRRRRVTDSRSSVRATCSPADHRRRASRRAARRRRAAARARRPLGARRRRPAAATTTAAHIPGSRYVDLDDRAVRPPDPEQRPPPAARPRRVRGDGDRAGASDPTRPSSPTTTTAA